ncbi:MAG TPA: UDP-N-acetylglucosamine 1-carboxyvinyltransferase [Thermoanaerobaculia bacterium]|jgi:UDP-N-acetylglucosamine 1-carboxyvinyltransferase|nr:UDP-N-acetylglucosamine 1-carboxyvinyltransferase [Thermoanaerobaculia bacterium]
MDRFRIIGPTRLAGSVSASGAKNAALPALAAALLTDRPIRFRRVPRVRDIRTMLRLLDHLGVGAGEIGAGGELTLERLATSGPPPIEAPYDLVKTMRAGVLVLGPLLARFGRARVSLPGGCAIGVRPIDQHLKGLEALGARVKLEHGYVEASCARLVGTRFRFDVATVTGTENLLMAACFARGTTVLDNCAREPEVVDLARLLRAMGAKIEGEGSEMIEIEGVDELHEAEHEVISDRIEGGTYLIGAALTGGDVTLEGADPAALAPLLEQLDRIGAAVAEGPEGIRVRADGRLNAADVETAPHPGFPTDLQAQYLALMTQAKGSATVRESVFENRFQHVPELMRMGADLQVEGRDVRVNGPTPLAGANVMATDLRASACLVLAGLVAEGETIVERIYHLDRGYEAMEVKLRALGARVERIAGPQTS